jgi:serine/threonine protein kinase
MAPRMLQPDTLLGTYRLLGKLGVGGMGEVWKAEDTRLGRLVAIKILPQAVAADAQAIGRMKREARTAAQLYHPNIATIHAFEEAEGRIFIVMEFVDGEPLTRLIARGPMAEADVCRVGRSVADALAEAHEKGIIHRDIKPDNVVVSGSRVKVLDFGIAKQVEQQSVNANDPTTVLTQQGMIIGTVFYMSPEQALGKPLDARTDLFSLGVVLYEAATGRRPFHGDTATDTITRIVRDEAPIPRSVSQGLATIITRCLRKDREQRFSSARELAQALEAQLAVAPTAPLTRPPAPASAAAPTVLTSAHVQPRRSNVWIWIAAVAALLLAGAVGAFVMSRATREAPPPQVAATPPTSTMMAPAPAVAEQTVTSTPVIEETTTTSAPPPAITTTTAAPPPAPVAQSTAAPAPASARSADDDYNEGVTHLLERQPLLARNAFRAALDKDPHHARAHFRLGEMALYIRDFPNAEPELNAAMADADRLDERERNLTELGLAIINGDRERVHMLIQEIQAGNPGDPDLMRFRQVIAETSPRPFRPRRLRPH